jgi:HK97 family phage prohead protease
MEKEQRSNKLKVEVRAQDDKKKIVGYAVKWEQLSDPIWGYFQEQFRKGAFANSLRENEVIATWQHNFEKILGRTPGTLTVEEDNIGLRYEIDPPSWADNYVETIERGDVSGSSFTFRATKTEWDDTNPDMSIRTVIEAELIEVAPVTFPAYPQSETGVRSAEAIFQEHRTLREKDNWKLNMQRKKLDLMEKSI